MINDNLEATAHSIYTKIIEDPFLEQISKGGWELSTLEDTCSIRTGKLNSEDATEDGNYPFFTCSQQTYLTDTFAFDQEAVLLAGNNASAIYPLKIFTGKFNAYQRTYVINSINDMVSNKQIYFVLKNKLYEFKGSSSGTTTKFLTMKILNPIPVIIPPNDVAYQYKRISDALFEQIEVNNMEMLRLVQFQNMILGRLSSC